jgi:hypothetical protein
MASVIDKLKEYSDLQELQAEATQKMKDIEAEVLREFGWVPAAKAHAPATVPPAQDPPAGKPVVAQQAAPKPIVATTLAVSPLERLGQYINMLAPGTEFSSVDFRSWWTRHVGPLPDLSLPALMYKAAVEGKLRFKLKRRSTKGGQIHIFAKLHTDERPATPPIKSEGTRGGINIPRDRAIKWLATRAPDEEFGSGDFRKWYTVTFTDYPLYNASSTFWELHKRGHIVISTRAKSACKPHLYKKVAVLKALAQLPTT